MRKTILKHHDKAARFIRSEGLDPNVIIAHNDSEESRQDNPFFQSLAKQLMQFEADETGEFLSFDDIVSQAYWQSTFSGISLAFHNNVIVDDVSCGIPECGWMIVDQRSSIRNTLPDRMVTPEEFKAEIGNAVGLDLSAIAFEDIPGSECVTPERIAMAVVSHGDVSFLERVLDANPDMNLDQLLPIGDGRSDGLIHMAIRSWHTQALTLLADRGASIELENSEGHTPLTLAADYGSIGSLTELLERKAAIGAANRKGRTALHYAVCDPHVGLMIVDPLLEAGADVMAKDNDGNTPMDLAEEMAKTVGPKFVIADRLRPLADEKLLNDVEPEKTSSGKVASL